MDRKYRWDRITGSSVICPGPCDISVIQITPTINVRGTIRVYDGVSTSDPLLATMVSTVTQTAIFNYPIPLTVKRGLYIEFVTTTDEVHVLYNTLEV